MNARQAVAAKDALVEWLLEYLWAPLVPAALALWARLRDQDRRQNAAEICLAKLEAREELVVEMIKDIQRTRSEFNDSVNALRQDMSAQHNQLRADQREDFREIRLEIGRAMNMPPVLPHG